jgi:hypothetical protein
VHWLPRRLIPDVLDRIACRLGIWALRRLYGADCATDVRADFPGEDLDCISCDAKRLVESMREILQDG